MSERITRIIKHGCVYLLAVAMLSACARDAKRTSSEIADASKPSPYIPATSNAQEALQPEYKVQKGEFNTEDYKKIDENEFLAVNENPLSTFSIDVDTASYSNVRRFINNGQLPPKDAVRIEELINYFKYNYPQPEGDAPFSISTELADCPWETSHKLVQIGLQGKNLDISKAPPSNLVFLLDTSGSMNSPDKLPLLKQAFKLLVNQLREKDHISIVAYAGSAGLVLEPTSGSNKEKILAAIERLEAGGSTAGGAGIQLAYNVAKENFIASGNNRVILATDGDFNVGVSSEGELVRLIEEKRQDGIFLTVVGFGTGNLKDSKMEQLADKGNGNYAYIDSVQEARKVFINEMGGTLFTIAKDVKIQVEFNPTRVQAYRLIGYENRLLKAEDFNDDRKDAGELGAGHSVTALYEIVPAGANAKLPKVDALKYQEKMTKLEAYASNEVMMIKLRYKAPQESDSKLLSRAVVDDRKNIESASVNFKFAAAVAEFGLLLRDSRFKANASHERCLELANQSRGEDEEGYRREFISLVEKSKDLLRKNG
ncbi:MAG: VWA domain-containing protein [Acidobacteriota bacterium]